MPNAEDINREYPERAQRLEKTGSATIRCTVNAQGRLVGCSVVSEDPAGYEFGAAAIRVSKYFKVRPKTSNGQPLDGGVFEKRITFRLDE